MLKSCWECFAGTIGNRDQADNDQSYGVRLNGDTQLRVPPWPGSTHINENMFILPRKLQYGDQIHVSGRFRENRQSLTLGLLTEAYGSPDYNNAACQVKLVFDPDQDQVELKSILNGDERVPNNYKPERATDYFSDSEFEFQFSLRYNQYNNGGQIEVDIQKGAAFLGAVDLLHNIESIRFLSVSGDVEKINKLDFEFA